MDRTEAQTLVQAELKEAHALGYERLRAEAPRLVPESEQPPGLFKRWIVRWGLMPESRTYRQVRGDSGVLYQVVREIDWDDEIGGALRIWAYVDDGESAKDPEVGCDLIYPPGSSGAHTQ